VGSVAAHPSRQKPTPVRGAEGGRREKKGRKRNHRLFTSPGADRPRY